jgi:hypothetical protein
MNTPRMTTRLLGGVLAALALLPGTAQAAALTPLKPCYISVTQQIAGEPDRITQERLDLAGNGFTPNALVDLSFDGTLDRTVQADAAGSLPPQVMKSPYRARGEGPFTLTAAEQGNPLNAVTLASRTTALALRVRPREARPQRRVRFRGRGFTDQKAVWAHYLHKGKVRKTVRLKRRIDNPCGSFSVRRRQIPIKRPETGKWTLQVDQQRRYSRAPDSVFVRVTIVVFRPQEG